MKAKVLRAHESHTMALDGLDFVLKNSKSETNSDSFLSKRLPSVRKLKRQHQKN